MSNLTPTLQTAIEQPIVYARWVCYLDVVGDPVRATTGLYDKTFSGTGDPDLDGDTYVPYPSDLISVSEVTHDEAGSNQVSVSMSGLIVNNADFLNTIGNRSNWQGRTARLWWYVVDENENQIGEVYSYYTGYMNDLTINGSPESQTITLTIEHYLVTLSVTTNKTYAMQKEYDAGDDSASRAISAANGANKAGVRTESEVSSGTTSSANADTRDATGTVREN
jgi:hypothetical protein